MPPTASIADLISATRKESGLSIREAARRASAYTRVSEGTWRRYESPDLTIPRDAVKLACMAAAVSISPAELRSCGRPDAARELEQLMTRVARHPDIASGFTTVEGEGFEALMAEILAGLADIDASGLPRLTKADLRQEFIAGLARVAVERRQHIRVVRNAAVNGPPEPPDSDVTGQ